MTHIALQVNTLTGHRLNYIELFAGYLQSRGMSVTVICTLAVPTSEQVTELRALGCRLVVRTVSTSGEVASLACQLEADRLVLLDGDTFLQSAIRVRPKLPTSILVMRPHAQHKGPRFFLGNMTKWALRQATRSLGYRVLSLESAIGVEPSRHGVLDPVSYSPVPTGLMPESLLRPMRQATVGVVGRIDERKNLPLLVDALLAGPETDLVLVIAGEFTLAVEQAWPAMQETLERAGIDVIRVQGRLPEGDLDYIISTLDVVVLLHSNEGPSGVLGKALVAGRRCLVGGARSLRRDAERVDHPGVLWAPLQIDRVSSSLRRVLASPPPPPVPTVRAENFVSRLLDS